MEELPFFAKIRAAHPDLAKLSEDETAKLAAWLANLPPRHISFARLQLEQKTGIDTYKGELDSERSWIAHLRAVRDYNQAPGQPLADRKKQQPEQQESKPTPENGPLVMGFYQNPYAPNSLTKATCHTAEDLRQWGESALAWLKNHIEKDHIPLTAPDGPAQDLVRHIYEKAFTLVPPEVRSRLAPVGKWPFEIEITCGQAFSFLEILKEWLDRKPASPDQATGQSEGKPKRRRGRKPDTDPKADKRIADAWETGSYSTCADCAKELGETEREVKKAIDRHRHRRPGKRRQALE